MRGYGILIFSAGLGIGSVAGWLFTKQYYSEQARIDKEETREYYRSKLEKLENASDEPDSKLKTREESKKLSNVNRNKPNLMDYYKIKEQYNTSKDIDDKDAEIDESEMESPKESDFDESLPPYTISPDRFAIYAGGYDKVSMTYYAGDGVLVTEDEEELVDDIDGTIGYENLDKYGEFDEDDVIYVRNERLGTDYEVFRDERNYKDISGN